MKLIEKKRLMSVSHISKNELRLNEKEASTNESILSHKEEENFSNDKSFKENIRYSLKDKNNSLELKESKVNQEDQTSMKNLVFLNNYCN